MQWCAERDSNPRPTVCKTDVRVGRLGRGGTPLLRWPAVGLVGEDLWGSGRGVFLGVLWPAARPRRCSQRPLRCLTRRLTAGSPFGQPRGWLSRSARF